MIEVLRKAAVVLSELGRHGDLTAAELSSLTEEPKASIYRMLSTLQELGLVARTPNRAASFRLGPKVLELASGVLRRYDVREVAAPVLGDLHEKTEHTIFLMVRNDERAVCIDKLDGKSVQSAELTVGGFMPLHVGAAPRCLLAFEDPTAWEDYTATHEITYRSPTAPRSPSAPIGTDALIERLTTIREVGYADADGETALGMAAIAAPLFGNDGTIQAAISISGPTPAILGDPHDELVAMIRASASAISSALGAAAPTSPSRLKSGR
jgi:DNA-binding IclR family transcriptional regulator